MAVYTQLTKSDIDAFLALYDAGALLSFKGIAEGVENSNYLLRCAPDKRYILTIYEQRVERADLPFFLGLTQWLADRGIVCPRPVAAKGGALIHSIYQKPAALIEFLEGRGSPTITPRHMELVGELAAKLHLAAQGFPLSRPNRLSLQGWQGLFERLRGRADAIAPGLEQTLADELAYVAAHWPRDLPAGIVHADLFPDNVFFIDGHTERPELSGVIDFYFACQDFWMYDVMICFNAWCFDTAHRFVPERARALLQAYERVRPLTAAERDAMKVLARGAALRFLLTRSFDWLNRPEGALVNPKDPMEYMAKLRFHQQASDGRGYGL